MALDKSRTSLGVKIVLIFVAVAMVGYLVPTLFGLFGSSGSNTPQSAQDVSAQIAQKYTAKIAANDSVLQSDPTSYTVLVVQGNNYYDWANEMSQAAQDNASLSGADQPMWLSARQYYERAVEINAGDPSVGTDLSIAYFSSGETTKAIVTAEGVSVANPDFASAWFNLGVFYAASSDNPKAIVAFEKAVALDPKGDKINVEYAKQSLQTLKSAGGTSTPSTTTP